jgi:hypothetical protein
VNIIVGNTSLIENGSTDVDQATETIRDRALQRKEMSGRARRIRQSVEGDRADVSTDILSNHYDEMTADEKMIHRREEMDWI